MVLLYSILFTLKMGMDLKKSFSERQAHHRERFSYSKCFGGGRGRYEIKPVLVTDMLTPRVPGRVSADNSDFFSAAGVEFPETKGLYCYDV